MGIIVEKVVQPYFKRCHIYKNRDDKQALCHLQSMGSEWLWSVTMERLSVPMEKRAILAH